MGRSHQGQFMALSIKREALRPTGSINREPMLLPFVFTVCEFSHWWKMTRKRKNMLSWKHTPSEILFPPDQSSLPTAMLFLLRNTFLQFDRCPLQARVWTLGLQLVVLFRETAEPLGMQGLSERDEMTMERPYADFLTWVKLPAPWCSCARCPLRLSHCRGRSSPTTMPPLLLLK